MNAAQQYRQMFVQRALSPGGYQVGGYMVGGARKKRSKGYKGMRHCVEFFKGPSGQYRCAKYQKGRGPQRYQPMRKCVRRKVGPSGKRRCAKYGMVALRPKGGYYGGNMMVPYGEHMMMGYGGAKRRPRRYVRRRIAPKPKIGLEVIKLIKHLLG